MSKLINEAREIVERLKRVDSNIGENEVVEAYEKAYTHLELKLSKVREWVDGKDWCDRCIYVRDMGDGCTTKKECWILDLKQIIK